MQPVQITLFQLIGVCCGVAAAAYAGKMAFREPARRKSSLLWCLVWMSVAAAMVQPDVTMVVAHAVGIRRGADLVSYMTTLGFLVASFWGYRRLRLADEQVTILVRKIALLEQKSSPAGSRTSQNATGSDLG